MPGVSRPVRADGKTIMITQRSHRRARPVLATPKAATRLSLLAIALGAVISGLLASAAVASAAFAATSTFPVPAGLYGPAAPAANPPRVISTGGMAGWQITLIALGAALAAAAAAVLLDRKLT